MRFWVERLEERYFLSATPFQSPLDDEIAGAAINSMPDQPVVATSLSYGKWLQDQGGASGAAIEDLLLPISPFPPEQTFFLHSLPGAAMTIYLDFDGHITRNTPWNTDEDNPIPSILTPAYTVDEDAEFSDVELSNIQIIWEQVAEDFRPFNVNVTTEEPDIEALRNTGVNDFQWGIRVLIGGSNQDWLFDDEVGGIAFLNSFTANEDIPCFAFSIGYTPPEMEGDPGTFFNIDPASIALVVSHEVGHTLGLGHDGQIVPPTPEEEDPDPLEYYGGHGGGPTGWGPIMGAPYGKALTQWSFGEYPLATNIEDDLAIITTGNGFTYRFDNVGNTTTFASILGSTSTEFYGEGIVERNTDIDIFRFTVGPRGEAITLDINPFHNGPNLDILAKLYNSSGVVIDQSNPADELDASFGASLAAGTYYVSIEGTGRQGSGAMDFGYTKYGSLGYYSIVGTRKELLVGVELDVVGGSVPINWTRYTGTPSPAVLTDLKNEANLTTPFNLAITAGSTPVRTAQAINAPTLPDHVQPLNNLDGYLSSTSWTFTWSDLDPTSAYEVFVFGLKGGAGKNDVTITGTGISEFTQTLVAGNLFINDEVGIDSRDLATFGQSVISTADGRIVVDVTPGENSTTATIAALAIRPAKPGSIQGQKWNDLDGNGVKDSGETGLAGWTIFLDEDGDGLWNPGLPQTVSSVNVPQSITDLATIKSVLSFQGAKVIEDVEVALDISHLFAGDVNAFLISPSGTRVKLFTDVGNTSPAGFHGTILDDEASVSITAGTAPFTGRFRPEPLDATDPTNPAPSINLFSFDGEDPNGVWTLEISDDAPGHTGVLNSWSLTIVTRERATSTDGDGNYLFDDLIPGEYHVHEVQQAGWVQTFASPPVTVTSASDIVDVDFGNWIPILLPSSIAGQKWNDLDGDGEKEAGEVGLADWTIYIDGNNNGILDPETSLTVASSDVPKAINDFSTVVSQLEFDGLSSIVNVELTLDITHSFADDIDAYLISPSGRQVKLFTGVGGQFNDFQNTTLADDAPTAIIDGAAPFTGRFRPEGLLSDFVDENPNGIWQLLVRDTAGGDEGTLNSWSLTIVGSERSTVTDENGNYIFEDLTPGSYIIREVPKPGWAQSAPLIPSGQSFWEVELSTSDVVADVDFGNREVDFLVGDYNTDGTVDTSDYIVWRSTQGDNVTPFSGADGDGSGVIDQADYNLWRAHFGDTLSPGGAAAASSVVVSAVPASKLALASAAAVEKPAPEPVALPSSAAVVVADATAPKAEQGSSDTASRPAGRVETFAPTVTRATPRAKVRITPASPVRDSAASDAAILAWLSSGGHGDRPTAPDGVRFASDEESAFGVQSEPCDSVDVVFEALGAA